MAKRIIACFTLIFFLSVLSLSPVFAESGNKCSDLKAQESSQKEGRFGFQRLKQIFKNKLRKHIKPKEAALLTTAALALMPEIAKAAEKAGVDGNSSMLHDALIYTGVIGGVSALSAVVSSTEAAILSVDRAKVQNLAMQGDKGAKRLLTVLDHIEDYIPTLVVLNNLINTPGAIAMANFGDPLLGSTLSTAVSTGSIMFIGEDLGKQVGVTKNIELAKLSTKVLPLARTAFTYVIPIIPLMKVHSKFGKKLIERASFGKIKFRPEVEIEGKEEIRQYLKAMFLSGVLKGDTYYALKSILNFDGITIKQILETKMKGLDEGTPAIKFFNSDMTIKDANKALEKMDYSRIPVLEEGGANDVPKITGICFRDDIRRAAQDPRYLEQPISVITSRMVEITSVEDTARTLLKHFIYGKRHLSIVMDGNKIRGVVTLEDIFETIIGQKILGEADYRENLVEVRRDIKDVDESLESRVRREMDKIQKQIDVLQNPMWIQRLLSRKSKREAQLSDLEKQGEAIREKYYRLSTEEKLEIFDAIWFDRYESQKSDFDLLLYKKYTHHQRLSWMLQREAPHEYQVLNDNLVKILTERAISTRDSRVQESPDNKYNWVRERMLTYLGELPLNRQLAFKKVYVNEIHKDAK